MSRGDVIGAPLAPDSGALGALGPAWYRLDALTGECWWSETTYRLYGYAPGGVAPSLDVVYRHTHPADRSKVRRLVQRAMTMGTPFAFEHRLINAHDQELAVIETMKVESWAPDGRPAVLSGVNVDVSGVPRAHYAAGADTPAGLLHEVATLAEGLESRTVIGRATGILMARLDVDSEVAFALLRARSQYFNVKLRRIAQRVNETGKLPMDLGPDPVERHRTGSPRQRRAESASQSAVQTPPDHSRAAG